MEDTGHRMSGIVRDRLYGTPGLGMAATGTIGHLTTGRHGPSNRRVRFDRRQEDVRLTIGRQRIVLQRRDRRELVRPQLVRQISGRRITGTGLGPRVELRELRDRNLSRRGRPSRGLRTTATGRELRVELRELRDRSLDRRSRRVLLNNDRLNSRGLRKTADRGRLISGRRSRRDRIRGMEVLSHNRDRGRALVREERFAGRIDDVGFTSR